MQHHGALWRIHVPTRCFDRDDTGNKINTQHNTNLQQRTANWNRRCGPVWTRCALWHDSFWQLSSAGR
ncbi:unnamed protein product [Lampetra planeri]